jgi:hypothetical protein
VKKLTDSGIELLNWIQPKLFQRAYELRAGDETVAALRWVNTFGSLVAIELADTKWLIKRSGFLWRRGVVHREGQAGDQATFQFGWFGKALLEVEGGERYHWARSKFWPPQWTFANSSGFPVARFSLARIMFRSKGEIELAENASLHRADIPILILAGWYFVLVIQRRRRRRS